MIKWIFQFDDVKIGDEEISKGHREKFERLIDDYIHDLNTTFILYKECLDLYENVMNKSMEEDMLYFNETDLIEYHTDAKNESLAKVSFFRRFYWTVNSSVDRRFWRQSFGLITFRLRNENHLEEINSIHIWTR